MFTSITIPAIVGAGLIDSINPCAFGVLIFLLTYLMALKAKEKMFSVGLVYIITVYVVYFLAGVGLLGVISSFSVVSLFLYWLSSILLIVLGLVNLKGFFFPNGGIVLKIPESKKPILEKWAKRASFPAAIVLGALVAAFELPCTGGIYLAILSLLAVKESFFSAVVYLLLYNLFFVLPLLIIWGIVLWTQSSEVVKNWFTKYKKILRLIMGIGMVALGVWILVL